MANDIRVKRFWTMQEIVQEREPRPNPQTPGAPIGEAKLTAIDWVEYVNRVNDQGMATSSIEERVHSLDPESLRIPAGMDGGEKEMFFKYRWSQIEPSYLAWKEGNELPESGTPLGIWAGITAEQANVFKLAGIRSVEDIRDMTANDVQRVRLPNVTEIQKMAKLYLESSGIAAAVAREASKDAQIATMQERMDAMQAMLEQALSAQAAPQTDAIKDEDMEKITEIFQLRTELDAANISYDKRWGIEKLRSALTSQAA